MDDPHPMVGVVAAVVDVSVSKNLTLLLTPTNFHTNNPKVLFKFSTCIVSIRIFTAFLVNFCFENAVRSLMETINVESLHKTLKLFKVLSD